VVNNDDAGQGGAGRAGDGVASISSTQVGAWLQELASSAPAPGGGAAAALNVAVGAALLEMVCNLTVGKPRYAEHEATMKRVLARAGELRAQALELADEDAEAFSVVSAAYKMPKEPPEARTARTAAIQVALSEAAAVPLRTAQAAAEVIELGSEILPGANTNVLSDVGVAAASARAGLEAAAVNVEINLSQLNETAERVELASQLDRYRQAAELADLVVKVVSRRVS
jgi:methenyltetrahydrofolate cyclohydrolase